ncbi:MAG: PQQ-binding-like beta-propeller repeat protein, partial [Xanthomonadales bacterium]|nr:PQQ-binding-like beta-propeller repeat protein [Xanthomonadales bacterium]
MVDFQWSQLNSEQQDFLRFNVATATLDSAAVGEARLEYIRGARDEEFVNGGTFRNRKSLLGAVVNSGATVISQPIGLYVDLPIDGDEANAVRGDEDAFSFEDGSAERNARYDQFRRSFRFRPERVYVGANDGMLHAFDGNSGEEIWGFVPYKVYPNLSRLSSPQDLDFQSYVDGTPEVRDAFIGGSWRTILVQTLRLGGQAVFAMDVTDANNPSLLWEYSDASSGGENLGFTYGQPYITRLHNGRWAALVPGGYNPEIADGNAGTREASLYVIDLQTGSLLRKFLLGNGTIGLGGVVGGDYALECEPGNLEFCTVTGANVRDVTDVAFAGDLTGNLWRFDLTDASPGSWTVDRMFQARNGDGFAQPITAQPWLAFTEDRQVVVLFGTGKYLEPKDRTLSIPVQSMYGIFDQGPAAAGYPVVGQNRLLRQNLSVLGSGRTLTVSTIDHSQHRGWYFDFLDQGERNIVRTGVRVGAGVGITPTLIPTSDDPCNPAARSFLLFFDVTNGGIPGSARPTDSNGDGIPDYIVSFDTNGDR